MHVPGGHRQQVKAPFSEEKPRSAGKREAGCAASSPDLASGKPGAGFSQLESNLGYSGCSVCLLTQTCVCCTDRMSCSRKVSMFFVFFFSIVV